MIYNVVLVSGVKQSDSVTYIHIFILFQIFFHVSYYRVWNGVPCAIQHILVYYLFYMYSSMHMLIPNS